MMLPTTPERPPPSRSPGPPPSGLSGPTIALSDDPAAGDREHHASKDLADPRHRLAGSHSERDTARDQAEHGAGAKHGQDVAAEIADHARDIAEAALRV